MADNTVTLRGTIGQEPERKTTDKGDVLNFTLAVNERIRNQDGSWSNGPTSWYRVNVWGALMRNASVSLHKGHPVVVQGNLRVSEYTTQSGATGKSVDLRASAIGHDLTFGTASFSRGGSTTTPTSPAQQAAPQLAPQLVGAGAPAEQPAWSTPMQQERVAPPAPPGTSESWAPSFTDEDSTPF